MIENKMQWLIGAINTLKGSNKDNWIYDITENTLLADLELDSLDVVELQMMYEDEVGYDIPDPEDNFYTVGGLLALMK